MMEVLLVLTLIAAAATAGLLGMFLVRARTAEREAREELSRGLATFSQTISTQMGSLATVQGGQIEAMRRSVEENLLRLQQENSAKLEQMRQTVDEKLRSTLDQISNRVNERLEEGFKKTNETFVSVM